MCDCGCGIKSKRECKIIEGSLNDQNLIEYEDLKAKRNQVADTIDALTTALSCMDKRLEELRFKL